MHPAKFPLTHSFLNVIFISKVKIMEKPYINAAIVEQFLTDIAFVFRHNYGEIELPVDDRAEDYIAEVISEHVAPMNPHLKANQLRLVSNILLLICGSSAMPMSINDGENLVDEYDEISHTQLEFDFDID